MNSYLCKQGGQVLLVNLRRGDLLLESIEEAVAKAGIEDAILTGAIGSLSKVSLHRVVGTGTEPEDEFLTLEAPMELASLQGVVLKGKAHFHMTVSDLENTYTGHLEPGTTVLYLCELSLLSLEPTDLKRVKDKNNIAVFSN